MLRPKKRMVMVNINPEPYVQRLIYGYSRAPIKVRPAQRSTLNLALRILRQVNRGVGRPVRAASCIDAGTPVES